MRVVKYTVHIIKEPLKHPTMPKLLALLSNPDDEVKLRMDRELKEINARLSYKVLHDFDCKQLSAVNVDELPGVLIREKPDLLHFSGHGTKSQLCFEDKMGKSKNVSNEALENIFKETGKYITSLMINACNSATLAQKISVFIPHVIGFPDIIEDEYAEVFSKTFYEVLSLGHNFGSAFELAKATIQSDVDQDRLPILYENKKLGNFGRTVFRDPYLVASFDENAKGQPIKKGANYYFNVDIRNLPLNTSYIIYEFIDDTIDEEIRFELVEDLGSGTECNRDFYGSVIVRAWLWLGEKKYGLGIDGNLKDCLLTYYDNNIPPKLNDAFQQISKE
jgi:hypothetical protein